MKILLWVMQILLSLWNIVGGVYMINNYQNIASVWALRTLPQPAWIILGILQVLFGLGLILPSLFKMIPKLIPISAICLAAISLLGIVLYLSYTGFPGILWAIIPTILAIYIGYKKRA
jgi:putative oxidoreductase